MRKEMSLVLPVCGKGQEGGRLASKAAKKAAALVTAVTLAIQYPYAFFAGGFDIPTVNSQKEPEQQEDP